VRSVSEDGGGRWAAGRCVARVEETGAEGAAAERQAAYQGRRA